METKLYTLEEIKKLFQELIYTVWFLFLVCNVCTVQYVCMSMSVKRKLVEYCFDASSPFSFVSLCILRFWHEFINSNWPTDCLNKTYGPYYWVNFDCALYLLENGFFQYNSEKLIAIAVYNHRLFRRIVDTKIVDPVKLLQDPAFNRKEYSREVQAHDDTLLYVLDSMGKNNETLIRLALIGHCAGIQLLINENIQLYEGVAIATALNGHSHCLDFLIKHSCPLSNQIVDALKHESRKTNCSYQIKTCLHVVDDYFEKCK